MKRRKYDYSKSGFDSIEIFPKNNIPTRKNVKQNWIRDHPEWGLYLGILTGMVILYVIVTMYAWFTTNQHIKDTPFDLLLDISTMNVVGYASFLMIKLLRMHEKEGKSTNCP